MTNKTVFTELDFDISKALQSLAKLELRWNEIQANMRKKGKDEAMSKATEEYKKAIEESVKYTKLQLEIQKKVSKELDKQTETSKANTKITKEHVRTLANLVKLASKGMTPLNEFKQSFGYQIKFDQLTREYNKNKKFGFFGSRVKPVDALALEHWKTQRDKLSKTIIDTEQIDINKLSTTQKNALSELKERYGVVNSEYKAAEKKVNRKLKIDNFMSKSADGMKKAISAASKSIKALVSTFGIDLKGMFSNVVQSISQKLSVNGIASYDTSSSIFTNKQARETQMQYGISGGQSYALNKTMSMLNMSGMEDLMYANSTQKQVFQTIMEKQSAWYDQMQSSGILQSIQMAQLDFAMMKEEMSNKFLIWIGDHKDQILAMMEGTFKVLNWIFNAISKLIDLFPKSHSSSYDSLYFSGANGSSGGNTTNNNININQNNTPTAILQGESQLRDSLSENNTMLIKQIASNISR